MTKQAIRAGYALPTMPDIGLIMAYEAGELDEEETIELFQGLIDSGAAWSLQGHYGRTAMALIEHGLCEPAR